MWQKRNEKPNKHLTKPAKVKLFKNQIKPIETTVISASSNLEGRIETDGTLIIDRFYERDYKVWFPGDYGRW